MLDKSLEELQAALTAFQGSMLAILSGENEAGQREHKLVRIDNVTGETNEIALGLTNSSGNEFMAILRIVKAANELRFYVEREKADQARAKAPAVRECLL